MAAGLNSTKRFLVRLSLITSSTIATIVGAQSLAVMDRPAVPQQNLVVSNDTTVPQAPPSIVILRHPGQTALNSAQSVTQSGAVVQPPQPITIAPPSPVIVSAPVQAVTRSSR
ncbi:MAG TPA: hypothetical protein VHP83_24305 [Aggregatilineaceae bacterium]|nr:hypothetical protein [Aggregatilineaceae bacterium]